MASGADGTIKVKLGLDDSEYKSGLSGAHKSAESFADKVKSTFVGATVFKVLITKLIANTVFKLNCTHN